MRPKRRSTRRASRRKSRRGVSSLDYMLIIAGVILPMALFFMPLGNSPGVAPRLIRVVYEMVCGLVSWPFL